MKTLTIRDEVYKKLLSIKDDDESFSEFFERLVDESSTAALLRRLRGSIEFEDGEKDEVLRDIASKREERRA